MGNINSSYENFSDNRLVGYYMFVLSKIYPGKLSNAMTLEIECLEGIAYKRGFHFTQKKNGDILIHIMPPIL